MSDLRYGCSLNLEPRMQAYDDAHSELHQMLVRDPARLGQPSEGHQGWVLKKFGALFANLKTDDLLGHLQTISRTLLTIEDRREEHPEEAEQQELESAVLGPKDIFEDVTYAEILEDLQAIELDILLEGVFEEEPFREMVKVVAPNLDKRNPYMNITARMVDWCRAHPILLESGVPMVGPVAEAYAAKIAEINGKRDIFPRLKCQA